MKRFGSRKAIAIAVALAAAPTGAGANPLAVGAGLNLLGRIFHHHRQATTIPTATAMQAQSISPSTATVPQARVEKVELERIRKEIARDRKIRNWKPLKKVKYLPANASVL